MWCIFTTLAPIMPHNRRATVRTPFVAHKGLQNLNSNWVSRLADWPVRYQHNKQRWRRRGQLNFKHIGPQICTEVEAPSKLALLQLLLLCLLLCEFLIPKVQKEPKTQNKKMRTIEQVAGLWASSADGRKPKRYLHSVLLLLFLCAERIRWQLFECAHNRTENTSNNYGTLVLVLVLRSLPASPCDRYTPPDLAVAVVVVLAIAVVVVVGSENVQTLSEIC